MKLRRRERRLILAVFLLLVMVVVAACGSGQPSAGDGTGGGSGGGSEGDGGNSGGGQGQLIRLTLGAGHPDGAITYTTWSRDFFVPTLKERVEAETDYRIEVNEAYGGAIAALGEILEAVETGLLDLGLVPYPFEPSKLYLHNVAYYVPFQSPDAGVIIRTTRKTFDANPVLTEMLEEQYNQKFLALAGWGDYNLVTTFEWENISELRGRKIAAAGPNLPWLDAVGAVPVQSNLNEAYTSMQTGVYDGWVMFPESVAGFKLHEVAPYYVLPHFGAVAAGGIHINLDTWNSLPPEVQEIVQEVALEYEETIVGAVETDVEKAMEQIRSEGGTIVELDAEQRRQWAEALPNIPNEHAQEANSMGLPGTKVLKDYLDLMADEGYEQPREWPID